MNLYVANLGIDTTPDELRRAFQAHGDVTSVSLPASGMKAGLGTGPSRGYAFVVMRDKAQGVAAQAALHLRELHGLPMTVQVAREARSRRPRR